MRVLLDEQLPRHLARELTGHHVRTVREQGWSGLKNGDRFSERRIGVDHLAFGVDDPAVLEEVVSALEAASVPTAGIEIDPVLGKSYVAFRDPDNVQWEFYLAT